MKEKNDLRQYNGFRFAYVLTFPSLSILCDATTGNDKRQQIID